VSLEARHLAFRYDEKPIIDDIDLTIRSGEMVAILGPNGAGKSTLLKLLCGLLRPSQGEVLIENTPIGQLPPRRLAQLVSLVSQDVNREVPFTVEEIVSMGRSPHTSFWGTMHVHDHKMVELALETTGTAELRRHLLNEISSGEFQRVMIAMALAKDTPYLFLDEPTAFLDLKHQVQIMELLQRLNREENKTIVTVTHDLNQAALFFSRILMVKFGKIPADGIAANVFTENNIRNIFEVNTSIETLPERGIVRITLEGS
jgi:iron complex transport system ATP-binding protein